jgi:hypothetical protein
MNTAEKIASTYLRLNGFFLLPHFTVFDGNQHNHIDLIGLRAPNSQEGVGQLVFPIDNTLFGVANAFFENPTAMPLGVVAEVRTNQRRDPPSKGHIDYVLRFLGGSPTISICFYEFDHAEPKKSGKIIDIGNSYTLSWILDRIDWMNNQGIKLTKEGSWYLSEEWLADILVLHRLGLLRKIQ